MRRFYEQLAEHYCKPGNIPLLQGHEDDMKLLFSQFTNVISRIHDEVKRVEGVDAVSQRDARRALKALVFFVRSSINRGLTDSLPDHKLL